MFVILGALLGAAFGARLAMKRGGNRADILQYAAVNLLIFSLLGLILTIVIEKIVT